MLMIIFGAGASYDSAPAFPASTWTVQSRKRPPLANELFSNRPLFVDAMVKFPKCQAIVPYLHNVPSVEQVLESLQNEAHEHTARHEQLVSVRYYLHMMLWQCEERWNEVTKGITNYKTLLDQVERRRRPEEKICLVTFNYDRLLESALPTVGVEITSLDSYIHNENYKLIKLHGSVDWGREIENQPIGVEVDFPWQVAYWVIDRAPNLLVSKRYRRVTQIPIGATGTVALFPALAIPVETKRNFECPDAHLALLQDCIPQVTKVLAIGWRATEKPFTQMLAHGLRRDIQAMVVAGGTHAARETIKHLQAEGISGHFTASASEFTKFIKNREADSFLRS